MEGWGCNLALVTLLWAEVESPHFEVNGTYAHPGGWGGMQPVSAEELVQAKSENKQLQEAADQ